MALVSMGAASFILTLLIEYRFFVKPRYMELPIYSLGGQPAVNVLYKVLFILL